jgi:hypothetical protein
VDFCFVHLHFSFEKFRCTQLAKAIMKKNLACEILRARAVCKAIFSLPRAAHPRGAFFIS